VQELEPHTQAVRPVATNKLIQKLQKVGGTRHSLVTDTSCYVRSTHTSSESEVGVSAVAIDNDETAVHIDEADHDNDKAVCDEAQTFVDDQNPMALI